MKEQEFTVRENDIYHSMEAESSYIAQAGKNSGIPEALCMHSTFTMNEAAMLGREISAAADECAAAITRYLAPCTVTVEIDPADSTRRQHTFRLMLPGNYPEGSLEALIRSITATMLNRCMQQWYLMTRPDEANIYTARLQTSQTALRALLSARSKPSVQ